jgi:hypothetical protein
MAKRTNTANKTDTYEAPISAKKTTVTVVYRPPDRFDPSFVEWNGIKFRANLAVELDPKNPNHYISQLMPHTRTLSDGETLTTHKPERMFMGDLARDNWQFETDGVQPKHLISTRVVPQAGEDWRQDHMGEIMEAAIADDMVGQLSGIPTSRR